MGKYDMKAKDYSALATVVFCSPRRHRPFALHVTSLRSAMTHWDCPTALLSVQQLKRWAGYARSAFGMPDEWRIRRSPASAGMHQFPDAWEIPHLLALAASDAQAYATPMRAGFAGIAVLLTHPFEDGNGRTCRFLWSLGLTTLGYSAAESAAKIAAFYGPEGLEGYSTLVSASAGDLNPFLDRWSKVLAGR